MKLKRAPNFSIEDLPFPVIVHRQKGGLIIDINAKAKKLFGLRAFKAKTIGEIRQTKLAKHKEKEGIDSIRYNAVPHITVKKKPALLSFSQKKIVSSGEKCFVDFYRCELDEALIGESKNTDQQLKESKSNFNRLQEVAGIGTWEMNGKFQEYHWSDEFYRIHGLKPQSVKPSTRLRLSMVHLRDRAKLQSALDRAYKEGKPYSLEKRIVLPNKEIRWVLSKGEVTTDQKTGKRKVFGTITDITQRKLQEQRESQITNRLRETLLFGRIGMVELNIKSGELEMHEEMLLLLEENNSSSKKIHVQDFIKRYVLEEDVASVFQKLKEGSALGHAEMKEVHVEFRMKTAKGNILFIDAHFTFRKDGTALGVLRDITLKRKAQQEALTSASKIETMLNGVTDGIFAVDNDLNFTMVNPVFAKQAQLKPNQMVGQNMLKLYPYMKGGVLVEAYKKAIKTQQSARIEHFNSIDPSQVFEINIYPNTQGLFVYYKDVSSVKKAQHNSLENEVYLNGILDSTNDGILAVNNEGKIIKSNDRFIELWKIPQELLSTGDDDLVLTHVVDQLTDPESFLIKVDELYHSLEQSFDILEFNDGRIFERYSRPLIITNEVAGRVWSFRDITTQRNSEVRFKSIFESTTDSIFFINKDYEIMAFNKIAYENTLAQFNQELAIGRNMLEIITPEAWPSFKENIDKAIDGELIQKEIEIHYPNHKNIWWFIQYIPVRDADGKIIGVSFNSTNIDDEKRANERIKALADNIPDGFIYEFLTNAEGSDYRFIYGSQGVENLFEMSVEEFTADASKVFQMTHPDDDEEAQRAFQKSLENLSNYESDYRITTRSGKLKWIRSKSRPILQSDGRILYEGISMDITHQKELEAEQALNRNKLQNTLDNMVSGVVVTDTEGFITYTNQSAADIFRISTDELKGNYYSLLQDRRVDNQGKGAPLEQSAIYLALHQQQTTRDMQAGFKNSDGSVTWLNVNGAPLIDENGKPYGAVISFIDQTAAIKARIQTEKSENNLRAILNNMVSGVVVTDSKGEITYINQSGAEIVGISKDSAAGNNYTVNDNVRIDFEGNPLPSKQSAIALALIHKKPINDLQYGLKKPDGKIVWLTASSAPLIDELGNIYGAVASFTDITELINARKKIEESENDLHAMLNASNDSTVYVDLKGIVRVINKSGLVRLKRFYQGPVIGEPYKNMFHYSVRDEYQSYFNRALQGEVLSFELENKFLDGVNWVEVRYLPVSNQRNKIIGVSQNITDITERKLAELSLKLSEERLLMLYHNTPAMMYSIDREGKIIRVSDYWLQKMNYTREEVIGRKSTEFLTEESRNRAITEIIPHFFDAGFVNNIEYDYVTKDGKILNCLLSASSERDSEGNVVKSLAVVTDITDKKKLELEVERLALIVKHTSNAVILCDALGRITWVNEGFEKLTEYSLQEAYGKKPGEFLQGPETNPATINYMSRCIAAGEGFKEEILNYSKSGRKYWLDIEIMPIRNDKGVLTGFMAIESDISQLKLAIEEMLNSETRLQTIMDRAPMSVFMKDIRGRYLFYNSEFETTLRDINIKSGVTDHDLFEKSVADVYRNQDLEVFKTEKSLSFETPLHDREYFTTKFPIRDQQGRVYALAGVSLDITERKLNEKKLIESEQRFKLLYNATPAMFHSIDKNGITLRVSDYWLIKMEYIREEVIGKPITDFMTSYSKEFTLKNSFPQFYRDGKISNIEIQFVTKSGNMLDTLLSAESQRDENGEVVMSFSVVTDITEKKILETVLKNSEANLKTVFSHTDTGYILFDTNLKTLSYNQNAFDFTLQVHGKNLETGSYFLSFFDESRHQQLKETMQKVMSGETVKYDRQTTFLDSSKWWFNIQYAPVFDHARVIGVLMSLNDITSKKESEEALLQSQQRMKAIFDNTINAIMLADDAGNYLEGNPAALKMLGYSLEEYKQLNVSQVAIAETVHRDLFNQFLKENEQKGEIDLRTKEGKIISVRYNAVANILPGLHLSILEDITEKKKAEFLLFEQAEEIRKRNEQFVSIAQNLPNGSIYQFMIRPDGGISMPFFSDGLAKRLGTTGEEIMNDIMAFNSRCHPDDVEVIQKAVYASAENLTDFRERVGRFKDNSGQYHNLGWYARPSKLEDGSILWQGVVMDETEQREAEKSLLFTRFTIDHSSDPVFWIKSDGTIADVNPAAHESLGYSFEEMLLMSVPDFDPHFTLSQYREHWNELRKNKTMLLQSQQRRKDGTLIDVEINANFIEFDGQEFNCAFVRNITERKKAQQALAQSEERLRSIIETEPNCIKLLNSNGELLEMNAAGLSMIEASSLATVTGRKVSDLVDAAFKKEFKALTETVINGGTGKLVFSITGLKGTKRWLETHAVPLKDLKSNQKFLLGITRDITLEKQAQQELLLAKDRLELATQAAGLGIWDADFQTGNILWDKGMAKIYGLDPVPKVLTKSEWSEFVHPEDLPALDKEDLENVIGNTTIYKGGFRILQKHSGEIKYVETLGSIERDAEGKVLRMTGVNMDRTNERVYEQQLIEGLKEKETLIKEIHHRVKNNLQLVSSIMYLKGRSMEEGPFKDFLEETRQKIKAIALIHERLLQTNSVDKVNTLDYLGRLITDLQMSHQDNESELQIYSEIEPFLITLDSAIYCGLIINELVTNAIKYAFDQQEKGIIKIKLAKHDLGYQLIVSNSGNTLPENINIGMKGSFGMQMLEIFIQQLKGEAKILRENGTTFIINFK